MKFNIYRYAGWALSFQIAFCGVFPQSCVSFGSESSYSLEDSGPIHDPVSAAALAERIRQQRVRVTEFAAIRETAMKFGLRAWLFGGTAAGFAHYVKWDMLRIAGDTRYIESRFDYDFTNIYRSTQDADLVVDGPADVAAQFESELKSQLAHLQGAKDDWEVRLLREDRGDKFALLNNPDFLGQHTDSNSTGMIELTDPPAGESLVRDLRDWENRIDPQFLKDVADGMLHYYFSDTHADTKLYKLGRNPSIFSVIRYFTKAFQYELAMRPEDLAKIQSLIDSFNPSSDLADSYAKRRIEVIGTRLFTHAANIEYAWDTLEKLGLRQKLISVSNPRSPKTMGWWLNREPLRARPLAETGPSPMGLRPQAASDSGQTLRDLLGRRGLDPAETVFSHETSDFLAWESLTRDTTGRPNVLISRQNAVGEAAVYGNGHYTRLGRLGARGTGFTVRYRANLEAREGVDFFVANGDYFIWLNRSALTVIQESLNISLLDYFEMLDSGKTFDASERGIVEKLKKRLEQHRGSREQVDAIWALVRHRLVEYAKAGGGDLPPVVLEWFTKPFSFEYADEAYDLLAQHATEGFNAAHFAQTVLVSRGWQSDPKILDQLIRFPSADQYTAKAFDRRLEADPQSGFRTDIVQTLLHRKKVDAWIAQSILGLPQAAQHPEWMQALINRGNSALDIQLIQHGLGKPHWKPKALWIQALLNRKNAAVDGALATHVLPYFPEERVKGWVLGMIRQVRATNEIAEHVLAQPGWEKHPEVVDALLESSKTHPFAILHHIARNVLASERWGSNVEWFKEVLSRKTVADEVMILALQKPHWSQASDLLDFALTFDLNRDEFRAAIVSQVFTRPHWTHRKPEWIEGLLKRKDHYQVVQNVIRFVFPDPRWEIPEEWVVELLNDVKNDHGQAIAQYVMPSLKWRGKQEWVEKLLQNPRNAKAIAEHVLVLPEYRNRSEWVQWLVDGGAVDAEIVNYVLPRAHWVDHPEWIQIYLDRGMWDLSLDQKILNQPHWQTHPLLIEACNGAVPNVACLRKAIEGGFSFFPDCDQLLSRFSDSD